jgi:hypothetical protein
MRSHCRVSASEHHHLRASSIRNFRQSERLYRTE